MDVAELARWSKTDLKGLQETINKAYHTQEGSVEALRHLVAYLRLSHFVVACYT